MSETRATSSEISLRQVANFEDTSGDIPPIPIGRVRPREVQLGDHTIQMCATSRNTSGGMSQKAWRRLWPGRCVTRERTRGLASSSSRRCRRTLTEADDSVQDGATVFDEREHISLHIAGDLSRLHKTGPLVKAPARAVVALDLDGQVFQAFCSEFRERCVEQLPPYTAPLPVRQDVDPGKLRRLRRSAHELRESDDIPARFGDEEARSLRHECAT